MHRSCTTRTQTRAHGHSHRDTPAHRTSFKAAQKSRKSHKTRHTTGKTARVHAPSVSRPLQPWKKTADPTREHRHIGKSVHTPTHKKRPQQMLRHSWKPHQWAPVCVPPPQRDGVSHKRQRWGIRLKRTSQDHMRHVLNNTHPHPKAGHRHPPLRKGQWHRHAFEPSGPWHAKSTDVKKPAKAG